MSNPAAIHPDPPAAAQTSVADRLIEIVCERTGYPAEMLGMGLDLEADLGIDSIKRVEILGTLRDSIDGLNSLNGSSVMDALARAKTLGEIVERVGSALAEQSSRTPTPTNFATAIPTPPDHLAPTTNPEPNRLRRLVLETVEAPAPESRSGLARGGTVLVTDDGRGVARSIADSLRREGLAVELAGSGWADLSSPSSIADRLAMLRDEGSLAGIIHAQTLGDSNSEGLDPARWAARLEPSLRGLFLLAREAADDLERSAQRGGACLIAATSMGGAFASVGASEIEFFPGHGGIAGLVKTLAREWPRVRTRVVDLDPNELPTVLAGHLVREATLDDGWPEVGYRDGRRIRLQTVERRVDPGTSEIDIRPGEPILITGGARGISAAVAIELARRWRPTLLLVGSSPLPPDVEDPETADINAAPALKAALLDRLRREGKEVGPSDLERSYRALLRAREIRQAIARMRAEGAEVDYAQADVRDADALSRSLDRWRMLHGDPIGLIHGAGVIHDKLLRDKTPGSFDRVLGTKLDGALNLARLLKGDALRFSALFSSVAGRFGNQGQSDYAAANEALNKLALQLDRRWPGRVVSINWGPWAGVGMVSDLQEHLGRRGLGMIDPRAGCRALVEELICGRKGEVEVILAADLGSLEGPLPIPEPSPVEALR